MSLRFALLGFLTTEPASGYRIAQEFSDSIGWFWYASHSQIHPELRRMEAEGLVVSVLDEGDPRGRRTYSITERGRAEFEDWLVKDTDYPPVRDAERIRLVFLDTQEPDVIRKHLLAHRDHHTALVESFAAQLHALRDGTFPRLRKRLASQPAERAHRVAGLKILAVEGNVMRAQQEVEWADRALEWVDSLQDSEAGA